MYHFVDKTSVNAQPLRPPMFENIAPYFKQKVFFLLCFFIYFFFIFSSMFEYPLPRPWARLVPCVVDFGPIFVRFCEKLSNDEGGNDKTTPPIGKPFLRPGGMRARAFRRPLRGHGVLDSHSKFRQTKNSKLKFLNLKFQT